VTERQEIAGKPDRAQQLKAVRELRMAHFKLIPAKKTSLPLGPRIALALVLLSAAAVYLNTILPGMGYSGDAAKFQFVGRILGVPHAPGYPLYVLLNRIFITIPVGSVSFRANLMSLFFSLLSLIFLYFILLRLRIAYHLAALTVLSFAFTVTFWKQSLVAEVYTLNSFFLALVFFFLLEWQQTGRQHFFYLATLVLGCSLAHHLTMFLLLPGFLPFLLLVRRKELWKIKTWLIGLGSLAAGFIPYVYVILRTHQHALYIEAPVRNFSDLIRVLTARRFQSALFAFSWKELATVRLPWFLEQIEKEWTWPLLLIILIGLVWLARANRAFSGLLFCFMFGQAIFILNYDIPDIAVFFIPVYFCLALGLGAGWQRLAELVSFKTLVGQRRLVSRLVAKAVPLFCLASSLSLAIGNFPQANLKGVTNYDGRLNALFDSLAAKQVVIILTDNYHESMFVNYKHWVEYPQPLVLHFELDPAEALLPQVKSKLNRELRSNASLQCWLFPDCGRGQPPVSLVERFWKGLVGSKKAELLASVYFISPSMRQWMASEGIKTRKVIGQEKKRGRRFFYYQAFLPAVF